MNAVTNIAKAREQKEQQARLHTWARVREPTWFASFRLMMAWFPHLEFPIDPCIRKTGEIIEIEAISGGDEAMYKMRFAAAGRNHTPIIRSFVEEDLEFLGHP